MAAENSECDVLIIGGGTAGCVVASRLHQLRSDLSITVVEKGPDAREHPYVQSPLTAPLLPTVGLVNIYETVPQPQFNGRKIRNFAGNMLSGSSGVNYGLWMRGSAADYDLWAQSAGDNRWSYAGLLPYLRKTEHHFDEKGDREQHGFEGPMYTTAGRDYPLRNTVLAAFKRLGYGESADGNSGKPSGIRTWTENWRDGKRQPAATVYDLSGVKLILETAVHRILTSKQAGEDWKATGVQLADGRKLVARRQVILSAGAHKNPQILMLSGIGPAKELLKYNITTIIDLPGVGQNLWDHFSLFQWWRLKNPEKGLAVGSPAFADNPKHALGNPAEFLVDDRVADDEIGEALQKDGAERSIGSTYPDLLPGRRHYTMLIVYAPMGLGGSETLDGSVITTIVLDYLPSSRGTITLSSADPEAQPVVDPKYYTTERDRLVLRSATRRMMQVIETPEMEEVVRDEIVGSEGKPLTSKSPDEDIDQRVAQDAQVWHHPSGTCAMGSVVDSKLMLKGTSNLRVIDSSVFPSPISATTQASVYALAESAADMLAKEL